MKKIVLLLFLAGLISCETPKTNSYTINGTLQNIPDSSMVVLVQKDKVLDSTRVVNGNFTMEGSVEEPIKITLVVNGTNNYKYFWLENSQIDFSAENGKFRQATITGSKTQLEGDAIQSKLQPYDDLQDEIDEYASENHKTLSKEQIDSLRTAYFDAEKKYFDVLLENIKERPNSLVALDLLEVYMTSIEDKDQVQSAFDIFSDALKNHPKGQKIAKYLAKSKIDIGDSYVDIALKNIKDQEITLAENLGDYTLLEFWASWCTPCRASNPKLVEIYSEFQPKGFEIFGVSFDKVKVDWLQAIEEDKLPWKNVVDLRGQRSDVGLQYGVNGLPHNLLFDKEGKVVAKGISTSDLEAKLKEVLN